MLGVALGSASLEKQGPLSPVHGGAIAKFLVARPGLVTAVVGLDEARASAGVDDVQVFVPAGGRVLPLTDSSKRAAYALAHGRTRAEATSRADAALGRVRIETQSEALEEATV